MADTLNGTFPPAGGECTATILSPHRNALEFRPGDLTAFAAGESSVTPSTTPPEVKLKPHGWPERRVRIRLSTDGPLSTALAFGFLFGLTTPERPTVKPIVSFFGSAARLKFGSARKRRLGTKEMQRTRRSCSCGCRKLVCLPVLIIRLLTSPARARF